mgnify:CR=1 FL=1
MPLVNPQSVVKGNAVNVKSLFGKCNYVPVYQRDFVWRDKQVEALWNDLISHYRSYEQEDCLINPEGYFLGAMVVIENEEQPDEIIDGQQRLTSLTTIATNCRDALIAIGEENQEIRAWTATLSQILASPDGGDFTPKLSFSDKEITDFFFNSVHTHSTKDAKETYWNDQPWKEKLKRKKSAFFKMREAIILGQQILDKFLSEVDGKERRLRRLISFIQLLTEGVMLLRITAMSYPRAYAIFESLNNRGIPLSQSDLIKNAVLEAANESCRLEVAEHWQNARQTVESIEIKTLSMPDFVHYSFISRNGMARSTKLYEKIKDNLSNGKQAKQYASGLEDDANLLYCLTESFDSDWTPETSNMLTDIKNVLNIKHCYPFLIAALRAHRKNLTLFNLHIKAVMNFAFRYMKVIDDPLENFTHTIGEACKMVSYGKDIGEIRALFREQAPDAKFIKNFEEASFPNTKLAYFTVYYLEKVLLNGTMPNGHGAEQNLEHIMPKQPGQYWSEAGKWKRESPDEFNEYVWRIGNLLPLPASINKSIKNNSIKDKLLHKSGKDYTSGGHSLVSPRGVRDFLVDEEWTKESIENRQKYLANNLAAKAWEL